MILLGAAQFDFGPQSGRCSHGESVPTMVCLIWASSRMAPGGENKQLLIAASDYIQPIGVFPAVRAHRATPTPVSNLLGVTEDHRARW